MENIDERQVEASRYLRAIREVANGRVKPVDALRMAIFLLYVDIMGRLEPSAARVDSIDKFKAQADVLTQEYVKTRSLFGARKGAYLDFRELPKDGLASLLNGAPLAEDRESKVRRLEYLIDALFDEELHESSALRVEKFVAHFSKALVGEGAMLLDLGRHSSGELAARVQKAASIWLPNLMHGAEFEVLLKLDVHGRQVRRSPFDPHLALEKWDFCLHLSPRRDLRVAELAHAVQGDSPGDSGLPMAIWFAKHSRPGQRAITLLTLRDCRDKGIRGELRRELIGSGAVRAVIELPRRVAIEGRQFILFLVQPQSVSDEQETLFVDGRACDALRDEPLERIASFLSVPFLSRNAGMLERVWPEWRHMLGSELALRASKMFLGGQHEVRGLHRSLPASFLLDTDITTLEPAAWIPALDSGDARAMLDPAPLREVLDGNRPCCAYVIGDNGAGKSFLLRGMVDHYLQSGRVVRALSSTASDRFPAESRIQPNYRYLGARTTAAGTSTRLLARKMLELLKAIHRDRERIAVLDRASELVGFKGRHFVLPAEGRMDDSLAALRSIEEIVDREVRAGDRPGFQRSDTSIIVPFDHLSAGEQQILLLLTRMVAEATPGALFLIDEPETSMHVAWQRALPGVLDVLRDSFRTQFVIATHSPVLISAATGRGNHRFAARGGLIEPLLDQASSVERILFDGFGTYTESNREVHERCAEIVAKAIERVNQGERAFVDVALGELADMRHTVERSIPALGAAGTDAHLRLIDRAKFVLDGLTGELAAGGAIA